MTKIGKCNNSPFDIFKKESKTVKKSFGFNCKGIYHIGSTAVKTVVPSKTIDMLVVVKDLDKVTDCEEKLTKSGYVCINANDPENGYLFIKTGEEFNFNLYVYQINDLDNTERLVAVRDYLRNHKDAAEEYSRFKTSTTQNTPEEYEEAKSKYLEKLQKKAVRWQRAQNRKVICISLGMCIGSGIGCSLGSANGNMALGVSLGIAIGLSIGIACGSAIEKRG